MKIAIAQLNPKIGDLIGNAQRILDVAHEAAAAGARLMLTPEMSISGYPPRDLLMQPSFIKAMADTVTQLAKDLPPGLAVLVGTAEPNERSHDKGEKSLFNSILLLEKGEIQQSFHKRLLPTYDVFDDGRYFASDACSNTFVLDGVRIGVTICEDLWNDEEFWGRRNYDENPLNDLYQQGAELIVNLSGSPYSAGKQQIREAMLSHAAQRYQLPLLYVNQIGGDDDLIFDGSSVGFNRAGKCVCRAKAFASDLCYIEAEAGTGDLQSGTIAPQPDCIEAELWAALVLGVRDYAQKCGFSKAVIGLSGGIDSSLVAAIATTALGADQVLGVMMPSPYNSAHSIQDAEALAANLGIRTETLPIGSLMEGYDSTLEFLFAGTEFGVAEENIQSRIRGNLLMAIANKFNYLLLSTGNKSELAVGYCTLYGDMNGGLAVIADVPKTQVYEICRWLNDQASQASTPTFLDSSLLPPAAPVLIPPHVINKAPSAELKPGQVDQDSLPSYEVLDDILERLIHQHQSFAEVVASGHDVEIVARVVKLVTRAEFKRRQAPPGIKVTDRAFGTGWRMPIASGWSNAATQRLHQLQQVTPTPA